MKLNETIDAKFDEMGLTEAQRFAVGLHILACFGAAIGHKPHVVYGEKTYGNLCMVIVGKTGIGKGATCRLAKEIFSGFGEDVAAPMLESTHATSMKTLLRSINNVLGDDIRAGRGEIRLYHINEEFGTELRSAASSYHSGLPGLKCRLTEGSSISETLGRQKIEYPLIHYSFVGHIQPEELRRCIRWHLITSGFVNRLLWFEMPQDMTTPIPRMTQEIKVAIEDDLSASHAFAKNRDEINMTPEANEMFSNFTADIADQAPNASEVMQNMFPRFAQQVLKIALVLSMLRRKGEIEKVAMEQAIDLVSQTQHTIQSYLVPPCPKGIESEILQYVQDSENIQARALIKTLMAKWSLSKIRKGIRELETNGLIQLKHIDNGDGTFPKCYVPCN